MAALPRRAENAWNGAGRSYIRANSVFCWERVPVSLIVCRYSTIYTGEQKITKITLRKGKQGTQIQLQQKQPFAVDERLNGDFERLELFSTLAPTKPLINEKIKTREGAFKIPRMNAGSSSSNERDYSLYRALWQMMKIRRELISEGRLSHSLGRLIALDIGTRRVVTTFRE